MAILGHAWNPFIGLGIRVVRWLVPSHATMEVQRISLSTLNVCGIAACGAGHDADNKERDERQALSRELRKLDMQVEEIRKKRETAEGEFDAISVLPIPGNPPIWQFWRPWFVSRELQRRTLQCAALNEIQAE